MGQDRRTQGVNSEIQGAPGRGPGMGRTWVGALGRARTPALTWQPLSSYSHTLCRSKGPSGWESGVPSVMSIRDEGA